MIIQNLKRLQQRLRYLAAVKLLLKNPEVSDEYKNDLRKQCKREGIKI